MTEWDILGIDPTSNKKEIRSAYSALLKKCHPEDDPMGFMRLRSAYEQALKLAEKVQTQHFIHDIDNDSLTESSEAHLVIAEIEEEETACRSTDIGSEFGYEYIQLEEPLADASSHSDMVYEQLNILYKDVFKRRDLYEWRKMFLQVSLAQRDNVKAEVLRFLKQHGHLPHEIWSYLNEEFSLLEITNFPWKALIQYDHELSLDYLDPHAACDFEHYADLRFQVFQLLQQMQYTESIKLGLEATLLYADDPVLHRLLGMAYYKRSEYEQAISAFTQILDRIPEHEDALIYRGYAYRHIGWFEEAVADFKLVIKNDAWHAEARKGLNLSLYAMNQRNKGSSSSKLLPYAMKGSDLETGLLYKCGEHLLVWPEPPPKGNFLTYLKQNSEVVPKIILFGIGFLVNVGLVIHVFSLLGDISIIPYLLIILPILFLITLIYYIDKLER
ncbi:hypothetical protein BBD42_23195 [Paenibacillus sp. BIHB 4019]|uniref:J domain-containing protein n=1 Tax=Paenibacillus sp. BIHB 4019 TaxID=1870819 RepID=A0A1B2DMY6_9BACL|nr:J domain-containing protein [Paenibacillus sp. BIHB 4019]ANY69063.1 hypothetical protein BBD42_23195 [Paenibacillus sp. BIHB 4019]